MYRHQYSIFIKKEREEILFFFYTIGIWYSEFDILTYVIIFGFRSSHFPEIFKRLYGCNISVYLISVRISGYNTTREYDYRKEFDSLSLLVGIFLRCRSSRL